MKNLKLEFKSHKIFNAVYNSLHVNSIKTNIYYCDTPTIYNPNEKQKAIAHSKMIENGFIYPEDGNFEMFDICSTFFADLTNAKIVDFKGCNENTISRLLGSSFLDKNLQDKTLSKIQTNKKEWTQWTKKICPKTNTILNNIGINFGENGYSVFFY